MNFLAKCPFCQHYLSSNREFSYNSPVTWYCTNCKVGGQSKIAIVTLPEPNSSMVRDMYFLTDKYKVHIYFFSKKTLVYSYSAVEAYKTINGEINYPLFITSKDPLVIIDEAPEIDFSDLPKLFHKIEIWVTFA